ncbi:MAG: hypothetical protein ABI220_05625 [Candidatus Saccharimonadales bacterium]
MQAGEYIVDRILPEMVKAASKRHQINCQLFSDDWVIKLSKGDKSRWILGYRFDINAAAASGLAQDKVATYQVLTDAGIPALQHVLARSVASQPMPETELTQTFGYSPVVMKPLSGTGGRGVQLQPDVRQALLAIGADAEPAWALSPYREVYSEYRLILLDGRVLLSYEKIGPTKRGGLKLFNLGLGAVARDIAPEKLNPKLSQLAASAVDELGLRLAAVDVIRTDQELEILEVNDGLMMENYASQSGENKDWATDIYDEVITQMFEQSSRATLGR